MKKLLILLMICTVLLPNSTFAVVENSSQWNIDPDESVMHLCTHRNFSEEWKGWIDEAVQILNDAEGKTGLSFEIVPFSTDRCQVFLVSRDIDEYKFAGSLVTPFDAVKQTDNTFDGEWNASVIVLDSYLEKTLEWIAPEEDQDDQFHDGWSVKEKEGTLDPVDMVLHAFGRSVGVMNHESYSFAAPSKNLFDTRKNGEHYHVLSEQDIEDLSAVFAQEDARIVHELSIGGGEVQDGDLRLDVPRNAFGFLYKDYEVYTLDAVSLIPSVTEVPSDYVPVLHAFGIYTDETIRVDIPAEFTYSEEMLDAATIPLATAEGVIAPAVDESTIQVVYFEKSTWDLTPLHVGQNPSQWRMVPDSEVDIENNLIQFTVDAPGIYGLIAKVDESVAGPAVDEFYQVVNGSVLTGEELKKRMFYQEIIRSILMQLPTFMIGIVCGALIMLLLRRPKSRKKGDGHSVPDIHRLEEIVMGDSD